MLEEEIEQQLPALTIDELFQVRVFVDKLTGVWITVLHSVEDNKTCRLSHPNLGMVLKETRETILKKSSSLKVRNGHA